MQLLDPPGNRPLVVITGATRGLGLALARTLDTTRDDVDVLAAVRDVPATEAAMRSFRRPPTIAALDLSCLADVAAFASALRSRRIAAVVHNAGSQFTGPTRFTAEGIEETIAVNHLAPALLTTALLPTLQPGTRVVVIGSGTHDPDHRGARRFGFRGARYTSVRELAEGRSDATSDRQRGLDRYATSKLLAMVTTMQLARERADLTFLTFDPGLMPGTGLVRTAPWWARAAWSTVLRLLVPIMSDASTPRRSASALARLLTEPVTSGEVYDLRGRPAHHVWAPAREVALGEQILRETRAVLGARAAA